VAHVLGDLTCRKVPPRLQLSLQETAASAFGRVPFRGPGAVKAWLPFMDLYLKLIEAVDRQIGVVRRRW
jgi:hypothetical protein